MKTYELLRKIRVNKGISQKSLSEGIITRATLSNYETGKNNIPFDILIELLSKLNIDTDEFIFYLNKDKFKEKNDSIKYFLEKTKEDSISKYSLDKLRSLAIQNNNVVDIRNYLIIKAYNWFNLPVNEQHLTFQDKKFLSILTKYLETVDEWGRFEMITFSSLLFFFKTSYIQTQISLIEKKLHRYSDFEIFQTIILGLYNNAFLLMLERKELVLSKHYLNKYKETYNTTLYSRENHIVCHFYHNLILHLEKNKKGSNELLNIFQGLELLNFQDLIIEFKTDLKKFEKIYAIQPLD